MDVGRHARKLPAEDITVIALHPLAPDVPAERPVPGVVAERRPPRPASIETVVPIDGQPQAAPPMTIPLVQPPVMATGGKEDALAQASEVYRRAVHVRLLDKRGYPVAALARGAEGRGVVVFRIDRAGKLIHAAIETSAGHPDLDRAALDLVRRAAPFPPIPEMLPDELEIGFPIGFLIVSPGAVGGAQ